MSEDPAAQSQCSAEQLFNQFCDSNDFREILQLFSSLCSQLEIDPNQYDGFYPLLKGSLTSWKATSLFQMLDARASLPEYNGQRACAGKRMLVVGAGPVGLRGAIELALLGARVDLVEKRPDFQRNNSLHLWPFLITDLRNLGAKKFYGKFASGAIDHVCIRVLQAILLKVCLILGVKVHPGVTFKGIIEPKDSSWRIETTPTTTPISSIDYDVVFAADGKKDSLPGFRIKEFRAKLALAITVNYVNHNTQQENSVPEIGGVAFVYRQDFFNNLAKTHGIELENIVYYKDETHYFVMTVRKQSLLRKGVLKKDSKDPKQLLSSANIDLTNLETFALEATTFATEGGLGQVEFETNHRGENDVALFDFTSLFAAQNAARIIERRGKQLLLCLAGDSLINPFWPTGSGCARGFLGAFDDAWMIKRFCSETVSPIELIEEREAILYLLPQTTPHRLNGNFTGYTIDPRTRYLNLSELVPPGDVSHLYDTDNQNAIAMVKTRSTVKASTQDKPKAAKEEKSLTIKRSKSSEVLSAEAHSATPSHPKEDTPEPSSSDVKNFWQKRLSVKKDSKPAEKDKEAGQKDLKAVTKEKHSIQKDKDVKDAKSTTKDTKATPQDTKPTPKENIQPLKQEGKTKASVKESPSTTRHTKPPLSPSSKGRQSPIKDYPMPSKGKVSPGPQQKDSPLKATSSKPPSGRDSPKASPKVSKKAQTFSKDKRSQKKETGSPKFSKLFSGSKLRARSESPEHSPKQPKKPTKEAKSDRKHPLSRSLQSLDKDPVGVANDDMQMNVQDIVKKYDLRAESLAKSEVRVGGSGRQSGAQASAKTKEESGAKGVSKRADPKKSKTEKKQDKSKEDKKSSKESKGGLFSFFKSRKTYSVAEASKGKKLKKSSSKDKPLKDLGEQSSVQRRIDQFKQIGLMTDGDDTDVVLVGVSPLKEEGKSEERMTPDESSSQSEDEIPSHVESSEEAVGVSEEGRSPSPEGNTPPVEEVKKETEEAETELEKGDKEREKEGAKDEVITTRVKKLKEMFSFDHCPVSTRHLSYARKRSKEIDLSDVPSQKLKPQVSDPLWLARVIQGLSKCLERLRKGHEIMVVKTALEIINTVLCNVQAHPESDVYRRVRVSSKSFSEKVWQLPEASQFLARAGWVEIDEFIVLPVEAKVDNAKRVLDKHLNIVNQMLWSRQFELPLSASGGVVRRPPTENRLKKQAATLTKRDSYATSVVNESMQRIEEDTPMFHPPSSDATDGKSQTPEESDMKGEGEEAQTMRAASVARNIWKQRSTSQDTGKGSSVHSLITDTELYGQPQSKAQLSGVSEQAPSEEGTDGQTDDVVADRLRKFNQSLSKKTPASSLGGGGVAKETTVEETSDASLKSVSPDTDNSSQQLTEEGSVAEQTSAGEKPAAQTDDVMANRLKKFNQSLSKKTPASSSGNGVAKDTAVEETSDVKSVSPDTDNSSPQLTEEGSVAEQTSAREKTAGQADDVMANHLKKFNQSLSKKTPASSSLGSGVKEISVDEETSDKTGLKSVSPDTGNSSPQLTEEGSVPEQTTAEEKTAGRADDAMADHLNKLNQPLSKKISASSVSEETSDKTSLKSVSPENDNSAPQLTEDGSVPEQVLAGEKSACQADDIMANRLKKFNQSLSKKTSASSLSVTEGVSGPGDEGVASSDSVTVKEETISDETPDTNKPSSPTTSNSSPSPEEGSRSNTVSQAPQSTEPQEDTACPPSPPLSSNSTPLSPSNSGRGDQLKQLLGAHTVSPSTEEETKNETEDQLKQETDAQHSTEHSIRNERKEYGNLTMEVAAQTREKWKQTEEELLKTADSKETPPQQAKQ